MMSDIDLLKKEQRKKLTLKRKELVNNKVVFNSKNLDNLFLKKDFIHIKIIASFFSIKTEISTFKLNTYLEWALNPNNHQITNNIRKAIISNLSSIQSKQEEN